MINISQISSACTDVVVTEVIEQHVKADIVTINPNMMTEKKNKLCMKNLAK